MQGVPEIAQRTPLTAVLQLPFCRIFQTLWVSNNPCQRSASSRPRSPKALVGTQSHRPLRNTPASSSTGSKRKQFQRCLSILFVRNITYEWKTEPTRSFAWLLFHDLPVPLHRAPQPLAEINDRLIAKQFSRQLNIRQRVSNIA